MKLRYSSLKNSIPKRKKATQRKIISATVLSLFTIPLLLAQQPIDRGFRFPAVYENQLVFVYAGDLYTVNTGGGTARKLTQHIGFESFPKFSHDGKKLAFTGQYDGNTEVYIMPSSGGEVKRITYTATLGRDDIADRMGPNNIVMDWAVDDQAVIYRSRSRSFNSFQGQLYRAPLSAEIAKPLPFSVAGWCSYNENGDLLAYNRVFREFRTWKYYRGGMADDIWLYDVKKGTSKNLTNNNAQDIFPMFHKQQVFFLSDRDRTMNLYSYDLSSGETKKVTAFTTYDIKFPSLTKDIIAFENGGWIYLYEIESGVLKKIDIQIKDDFAGGRPRWVDASEQLVNYTFSADGNSVAVAARGEIFTIPAQKGPTHRLTHSSGAHDHYVEASPNGDRLAYISDRSGEDELYIQEMKPASQAKQLSKSIQGYKYNPRWAPDGDKILLSNRANGLYWIEVETGRETLIKRTDVWEIRSYTWSPNSRYVAYILANPSQRNELWVYDLNTRENHRLTQGWFEVSSPCFSQDGQYLFFGSERNFNATYSRIEWNYAYLDLEKIYYISLSDKVPSLTPVAEVERMKEDTNTNVLDEIKWEGIQDRVEVLPVPAGNYWGLTSVKEGLYYYFYETGMEKPELKYFLYEDKKEIKLGRFDGYRISHDQKKILLKKEDEFYVVERGGELPELKESLNLSGLQIMVDPKSEWKQIFYEAWRQMRDFFYDPDMHGVDWKAIQKKYEVLLPYINHRNDLNYLIGEMIGELNVGHAYVTGGERPEVTRVKMGLLGAQFKRDASGYYQITHILKGEGWDKNLYSPLMEAEGGAKEGEFILAIDGISTKTLPNLYEVLIGKAGHIITITLNGTPKQEGARTLMVKPVSDESELYYHEWVEQNLQKVAEASNGEIGYLHIPDMGPGGLNQFVRYFYGQLDKKALIIDDRGNGGGNVSPMIIERLRREVALYGIARNNKFPSPRPRATFMGHMACLIDQYSASDGDLFPYQFKYYQLGPVIGQRSWGGVVGIRGSLPFIDGGGLNKPEFAHFKVDGADWIIEGYGVDPDIKVVNDPHEVFEGKDAQLEKAIEILKKKIEEEPVEIPKTPDFPDKSK